MSEGVIVLGLFDAFKKKEPIQWKTISKALYDAERKAVHGGHVDVSIIKLLDS